MSDGLEPATAWTTAGAPRPSAKMARGWTDADAGRATPFRRLRGVYAGAQARVAARYHRLIDTKDFQASRVFKPAGITAVHSPVHDS